jgi:NitT/TauT family transport system substrate-binding protein
MKKIMMMVLAAMVVCCLPMNSFGAEKKTTVYRYVWSHYTGWEFWQFISESGIMQKWNDKYGVKIEIVLINDYVQSINQFVAGEAVGCAMTNMDALNMPAIGGIDSDILVIGDYSNGNDGIVLMNGKSLKDLIGRKSLIVQGSVSSYLQSKGLKSIGRKDNEVTEVNTSDANIGAAFASSGSQGACVTWNPILMQIRNLPNATMVFDSSKIPGEIQDLMVVRRDAPDAVKKALVGAWYEAMSIMTSQGKKKDEMIESLAKFAGGTTAEFNAQLKTTFMYYKPADAVKFAESADNKRIAKDVAEFCFDHGLLGQDAKSALHVGIEFPDGTVYGNPKNVKLHYRSNYMKMAADGSL